MRRVWQATVRDFSSPFFENFFYAFRGSSRHWKTSRSKVPLPPPLPPFPPSPLPPRHPTPPHVTPCSTNYGKRVDETHLTHSHDFTVSYHAEGNWAFERHHFQTGRDRRWRCGNRSGRGRHPAAVHRRHRKPPKDCHNFETTSQVVWILQNTRVHDHQPASARLHASLTRMVWRKFSARSFRPSRTIFKWPDEFTSRGQHCVKAGRFSGLKRQRRLFKYFPYKSLIGSSGLNIIYKRTFIYP